MDLLKQSTGQAREVISAMPMQSRVISILLVVAIVVSLAFLVRRTDSIGREMLFGGRMLTEPELDAIELAFGHAGLSDWRREGRRIEIPSSAKAAYLAALDESKGLPNSIGGYMDEALKATNVFDPSGLRDSREMLAKQRDLGVKIAAFPDVQSASVEYDEGDRVGLSRSRPQSASVLVVPEGNLPLPRSRIKDIENLVRGSYAGLSADNIVVIDTNSTSSSPSSDDDDPLLRKEREAEARVEQKVRSLLAGFPVKVAVAAEIDPTMEVEKQILKYDTDPTPVSNKTTRIEVTNSRQPVGGVPGVAINAIGNRAASLSEPEPSGVETSRTKEDQRESIGVAGQHYENSKLAALQVKSVRVSVGLPTSYYENLHSQEFLKQNVDKAATDVPPLTDDDLENLRTRTKKTIQSAVTVLLPKEVAGSDRLPQVEVWDYTELPEPQLIEPETPHVALTWLAESWQTLALIGLGILALLVAHSVARSVTRGSSPAPDAFASARALENPHETPMSEHQDEERWRTNGSGKSLRDELLMLVEDNPEAAASVIRGWVAEAA